MRARRENIPVYFYFPPHIIVVDSCHYTACASDQRIVVGRYFILGAQQVFYGERSDESEHAHRYGGKND